MQQLLLLETGGCSTVISSVVPVRITAELSSRDSTLQNQGTHSGWIEPPCPSRYVGYQLREFLSAVLVLLRLEPLQAQQLQNQSAVDQLQYEVLQVSHMSNLSSNWIHMQLEQAFVFKCKNLRVQHPCRLLRSVQKLFMHI